MRTKRVKIPGYAIRRRGRTEIMAAGFLIYVFLVLSVSAVLAAVGDPVETIANPANTTIDVFDFWVYDNRGSSVTNFFNTGINRGHQFVFSGNGDGGNYGDWNKYTGPGGPRYGGIVEPLLDENGYPVLAVGNGESLAYLFNDENIDDEVLHKPAKRSYTGANYLFTVNEDGYYAFDSVIHNATLNTQTREFSVTEQTGGMFYPLAKTGNDRHFFGMHVQADFSVPADGQVVSPSGVKQDMVYEFRGDDDVWMFIDGVLVGDAGGIHNPHGLTVNFVTGEVHVWNADHNKHHFYTTIYDMFAAALGEEEAQARYQWKREPDGSYKTFSGNTYHTMDFFYLERGAGRSNMEVQYNMVSTYDFTGHKTLLNADPSVTTVLQRNQFKFKLTGFPIEINKEGLRWLEPVMPVTRPDANVIWDPVDYDLYPLTLENQIRAARGNRPKTLIVGNSADGNINFGNAELRSGGDSHDSVMSLYMDRTFRYVYEELPPDGAVLNADGVTYTWKGKRFLPIRTEGIPSTRSPMT